MSTTLDEARLLANKIESQYGTVRKLIANHPMKAAAIILGVGYLLGYIHY